MPDSPRRSGRSRKVNTKYANGGWSKETLRLLRESSESSNPTSVDTEAESLHNEDEEFEEAENLIASAEADAEEDALSIASDSSKSSQVATPRNEDEISIATSEDEGGNTTRRSQYKKPAQPHSRGLSTVERGRSVKGGVWQSMFGPEVRDLHPVLKAKDKWLFNLRDTTLPSWKTIAEVRRTDWARGDCGRVVEAEYGAIPVDAKQKQELKQIAFSEAKKRYFVVGGIDHKIVLGPWSKQQAYDLPYSKPASLGQAWRVHAAVSEFSYHSGWLLNVAEKPQCMAWAPHQIQDQYLALVCRSTPEQRGVASNIETQLTPAFASSPLYPAGIQMWRFATQEHNDGGKRINFTVQPQLIQILACNFGDIKQVSWAPESGSAAYEQAKEQIGILAVLTTDGCVRLIQVPNPSPSSDEPICLEVLSPILTLSPPRDAVFTCFTFASQIDLVLGVSSGHVHIYNILQALSTHKPEPYFNYQIHHTYVLSVCSVGEAEYSHYLASLSAAGSIQLTDLRCPSQDTLTMPRARLPTRNLIYNSHSRAFITTIDSSGNTEPRGTAQTTIAAHNLRHFYSASALSKFPEGSGTATALAGSPLHPCILMGNTGGTVWAQNAIRRIFPTGKPGAKNDGGAWVQKVVDYEWIPRPSQQQPQPQPQPQNPPEHSASSSSSLHYGVPTRPGTSRMHHGFKPERLDLSNVGSKKRKVAVSGPNVDSAIQVIFEEEQAVSAIAWNVNPVAATWASVGWGSGVVLITDLGHATE